MKTVMFLGSSDKSDLLLYIGKCMMVSSKKVIIIDQTIIQKYRYSVPVIEDNKGKDKYITTYEGVDVAVGFKSYEDIEKYCHDRHDPFEAYDIVILDIDRVEPYLEFAKKTVDKYYLVMDYEKMTLARTMEILSEIVKKTDMEKTEITRIVFTNYLPQIDQKYIETLLSDFNVEWGLDYFEIMYNEQDREINIKDQYSNKLLLSKHTGPYRNAVIEISSNLLGGLKSNYIKKLIDIYERGKK